MTRPGYAVVIPTIGRPRFAQLVATVDGDPPPSSIVVADDRRDATSALDLPATSAPLVVVRTNGRGPAAARNAGRCASNADWIAFLDDGVAIPIDWCRRLADDLDGLPNEVLGLRTVRAGYAIAWGERVTTHPLASPNTWRSRPKDQAGNTGNALPREIWASLAPANRCLTRTDRPSPAHHHRDCGIGGYVFQPRRGAACPRQLDSRRGGGGLWPSTSSGCMITKGARWL
jgi:glycosyltransferase involved in cell wall biosynthesis